MKNSLLLFNTLFWFEAIFTALALLASFYTFETIFYLPQLQQLAYLGGIIGQIIILVALFGIWQHRKWGITMLFSALVLFVCLDLTEAYYDFSKLFGLSIFDMIIYATVNMTRTIFIGISHIIAWVAVLQPIKSSFK